MFNIKMRKNSGTRQAGAVTNYKKEEKKVVKSVKKYDYSTYENAIEATLSQKEAVNEVLKNI